MLLWVKDDFGGKRWLFVMCKWYTTPYRCYILSMSFVIRFSKTIPTLRGSWLIETSMLPLCFIKLRYWICIVILLVNFLAKKKKKKDYSLLGLKWNYPQTLGSEETTSAEVILALGVSIGLGQPTNPRVLCNILLSIILCLSFNNTLRGCY